MFFFDAFVRGGLLYFGVGFCRVVGAIFAACHILPLSLCFCCFVAAGCYVVRVAYNTEFVNCFVCVSFVSDMIMALAIVFHMLPRYTLVYLAAF